MECPICKDQNPDGKNYCANCGASLKIQTIQDIDSKGIENAITRNVTGNLISWVMRVGVPFIVLLLAMVGYDQYNDFVTRGRIDDAIEKTKEDLEERAETVVGEAQIKFDNLFDETAGIVSQRLAVVEEAQKTTAASVVELQESINPTRSESCFPAIPVKPIQSGATYHGVFSVAEVKDQVVGLLLKDSLVRVGEIRFVYTPDGGKIFSIVDLVNSNCELMDYENNDSLEREKVVADQVITVITGSGKRYLLRFRADATTLRFDFTG